MPLIFPNTRADKFRNILTKTYGFVKEEINKNIALYAEKGGTCRSPVDYFLFWKFVGHVQVTCSVIIL